MAAGGASSPEGNTFPASDAGPALMAPRAVAAEGKRKERKDKKEATAWKRGGGRFRGGKTDPSPAAAFPFFYFFGKKEREKFPEGGAMLGKKRPFFRPRQHAGGVVVCRSPGVCVCAHRHPLRAPAGGALESLRLKLGFPAASSRVRFSRRLRSPVRGPPFLSAALLWALRCSRPLFVYILSRFAFFCFPRPLLPAVDVAPCLPSWHEIVYVREQKKKAVTTPPSVRWTCFPGPAGKSET